MHSFINLSSRCFPKENEIYAFSVSFCQLSFSVLCLTATPSKTSESSAPFQPNLRREKTLREFSTSFMHEDVQGGEGSSFEARAVYKSILYWKAIREAILDLKLERHVYRTLDFMNSNKFHGMLFISVELFKCLKIKTPNNIQVRTV